MTQEQKDVVWHVEQFLKNGRWGTCVDCGLGGSADPAACVNAKRIDHQLGLADLQDLIRRYAPKEHAPRGHR